MLGYSSYFGKQWLPTCSRRAVIRGVLAQASPTIVGAGIDRSIPIHLPSPTTPEPSVTSVAVHDYALTFSFASSILLSAFLAATISWEYMVSGLPCRYLTESLICLCTPWNSQSLRWHTTSQPTILPGHFSQI